MSGHRFKRIAPRIRVNLLAKIKSSGNSYCGNVFNLSAGGIFLFSQHTLRPGEIVKIDISFEQLNFESPLVSKLMQLKTTGEVVWDRKDGQDLPPGLGLRFVHLSPSQQDFIKNYIQNRSALVIA